MAQRRDVQGNNSSACQENAALPSKLLSVGHWLVHRLPHCLHSLHRSQQLRHVPHASKANNSFDAEEDLDADLAEELSRFRSPDTWNKVAQHLDLVWKIGRVGG